MKSIKLYAMCSLFASVCSFAQTSTETFETEINASASFTDNGVIFNILSQVNTYDIQGNYPASGWNGTSFDDRYIDNSGQFNQSSGTSFSIKTTSNLFKINRFWVYAAASDLSLAVSGTVTVTGKLSGVTKFTQTKTTGFATELGNTNGFTLIDFTNLNGQNYSNLIIDELQITAGGGYRYLAVDAFTWVKDLGLVLNANDVTHSVKKGLTIYPNPTNGDFTISTDDNTKAELYDQSGKMLKSFDVKKGTHEEHISEFPAGIYILKTPLGTEKIIKR